MSQCDGHLRLTDCDAAGVGLQLFREGSQRDGSSFELNPIFDTEWSLGIGKTNDVEKIAHFPLLGISLFRGVRKQEIMVALFYRYFQAEQQLIAPLIIEVHAESNRFYIKPN